MEVIVYVEGIGEIKVDESCTLADVAKKAFPKDYKKYLGVRIKNEVFNLNKFVENHMYIRFLDITDTNGYRIYTKTISAIFIMACKDLYPDRTVKIQHFLGPGLYAEFGNGSTINFKEIKEITKKMKEIIEKDYSITREMTPKSLAMEIFKENNYTEKIRLFNTLDKDDIHIYSIGGHKDTFHGFLAPYTSYADVFELKYYFPGLIIQFPNTKSNFAIPPYKELKKLSKVFEETAHWVEILDLAYVGSLNEKIIKGEIAEVIRVSEALHEKKVSNIADQICADKDIHLILIAGPSSSGKTTFANRLAIQLKANGKRPVSISVDDYFVDREK